MKNLCVSLSLCTILWSCGLFSAAHNGTLFIQNSHPRFQFECMYKVNGQQMGPITVYKDEIPLGPVDSVTDVQIKRYGSVVGLGASYYSFPDQLAECKRQSNRDWLLNITWSLKGWDVTAQLRGQPARREELKNALDYFSKASAYGDLAEPRHVLDLPVVYTATGVTQRQQVLRQQIQSDGTLLAELKSRVLALLENAASYATRLLQANSASPEYQKLLLEWRGKLHPERVARGRQLSCDLLRGSDLHVAQPDTYLTAIIDLIWFFYSQALTKNQAFDEGTFIIQDTQHTFYNFLMNYVKMVNPSIKGTLEDPALKISTSNAQAYSRLSSHFKNEQEKFRHYGIDMRFAILQLAQTLLPAQKTHILFGRISADLMFIKLENVGIAAQSVVIHGKEFVGAQIRKLVPGLKNYLQSYMPTYVDDLVMYYIGTDDDPNYRKERIPQEFLVKSLEILRSEHLTDQQIRALLYTFSTQGIHGAYNEINNPASLLSGAQRAALSEYLAGLVAQGLDNQNIRYGREVILTRDDLMRQCH